MADPMERVREGYRPSTRHLSSTSGILNPIYVLPILLKNIYKKKRFQTVPWKGLEYVVLLKFGILFIYQETPAMPRPPREVVRRTAGSLGEELWHYTYALKLLQLAL